MKGKEMKHVGFSADRLSREPREKVFAEAWKKINSKPYVTFEYLIPYPTERDATVAATVMQWLGSPVGFDWLEDTLNKAGYKVKRPREDR